MHQLVGGTEQTLVASPELQNRREYLLAFAAGASILVASLGNFLLHNDYPLFRLDVAMVVGGLLLLAAAMAALYVGRRQLGRSVLDGLLVMFFADLNGVQLTWALLAGLAVALFTYWRKISFSGPLAFFGAVVLLTKLAGVGGRETWMHAESHAAPKCRAPPRRSSPSFT